MKTNRLNIFFVVIVLNLIAFNTFCNNPELNSLRQLNFKITGKVIAVDKTNYFNNYNVFTVSIIQSNVNHYDPRLTEEYYYCIIKDDIAEFYQLGCRITEVGDTIYVDTGEELFYNISKSKKVSIGINNDQRFYDYVKKNHQKF